MSEVPETTQPESTSEPSSTESFALGTQASIPDTPSGGGSEPDTSTSSPDSTAPSFDYSSWNGQSESLPEAYRPIYEKISGGLRSQMEDLQNSLQQDKELYEALLQAEGVDADVRKKLQDAERELTSLREARTGWTAEKSELSQTRDSLQAKIAEIERVEQAQIQGWVDQFKLQHKDMLADDNNRERFLQYLESGMEPEFAVTLMDKDRQFVQRIQVYRHQGVPDQYALKLATADLGTEAAKPRASAEMAAGAGEAANNPSSAQKDVSVGNHNIRDIRRLVAERAFKKHTG